MKKVLVSLVLVSLMVSVSLAAPKASQRLLTLSQPAISESAPSNNLRIGVIGQAAPVGFGTIATGGMRFNEKMSGDIGLAYGTNIAGTTSNIGLLLRFEYDLATIDKIKTKVGGNLMFSTNNVYAVAAATSITLNGYVGAEYLLLSNLALLADIVVLEVNSLGGVTTFGIGSGTPSGTGLGAGAFAISPFSFVTGARLYI